MYQQSLQSWHCVYFQPVWRKTESFAGRKLRFFSCHRNRSVRYTSDAVLGARRWPHHWSGLVVIKLRKGSKKRTRGTRTLWLFGITNSGITAFRSPVCCGCDRLGTRVRRFDAGVFVGLYWHRIRRAGCLLVGSNSTSRVSRCTVF